MPSTPTVTVLLAVYNGQKYLREAVDSVLNQTFTDFEFLIIDDGSKDDSLKILQDYAARDSRVRVITRPNKGLTKTLNEGLREARGEFLARMDADDVCLPERLKKQIAYLREHPDCVMVGSQIEFIDPEGCVIGPKPGVDLDHDTIDAALLKKGWPLVHPAVTIRTAVLREIGGYSEAYTTNQDHDLFLRLAERGKVANLPDVLLRYRQHFESVSLSKSKLQGETVEKILRETYARRGLTMPAGLAESRPKQMSRLDHHKSWFWAALQAGNIKTARKHALATWKQQPFAGESWKMLYCAVRGR